MQGLTVTAAFQFDEFGPFNAQLCRHCCGQLLQIGRFGTNRKHALTGIEHSGQFGKLAIDPGLQNMGRIDIFGQQASALPVAQKNLATFLAILARLDLDPGSNILLARLRTDCPGQL